MERELKHEHAADLIDYQAEMAREEFVKVFWNGSYLYDYVEGSYNDKEVRPNMIFAVGLPYSQIGRAHV